MKRIFLNEDEPMVHRVYPPEIKAEIDCHQVYSTAYVLAHPEEFRDTEFIFSTWGLDMLTEEDLKKYMPNLKAVFYAAGSVKGFAPRVIRNGVMVCSGWGANAVPVAEYTVAQIILANKGFFVSSRLQSEGKPEEAFEIQKNFKGNFNVTVGIIGAGQIGALVCRMLKSYRVHVLVYDPFLSDERAEALGVKKASLEEIFDTCEVVSNHIADKPETKGIFHYGLFSRMKPYASFINTGRGGQVVEADLARILQERSDLTALLDVTEPEPPEQGHPFYSLPNCIMTPHIAGSYANEFHRMAEYMRDEYFRFLKGEPCIYEVTEQVLKTMA